MKRSAHLSPTKRNLAVLLLSFGLFVHSCASTQQIVVSNEPVVETTQESPVETLGYNPDDYLIKPELAFYSVENTIPEAFQVDVALSQANTNSGFRVQIISTQDVRLAENLRIEFNSWLDDEVPEYNANAYILFRQPFYRLHVGDFRSRADAIEFAQVVKRKFPDAWVVFDTIDPNSLTRKNTGRQ